MADAADGVVDGETIDKGWAIWPLDPVQLSRPVDMPGVAPSPPTRDNWLGTDDTKRDVLARVIYGFRLSIFFTLIVTTITSIVGIAAGAVQGYFGGWIDLIFQRFLEIWGSTPVALRHHHPVRDPRPKLLAAGLRHLPVRLDPRWSAWFAPSSCAPATSNTSAPPARWASSNRTIMFRHVLPNAMVATLTMLPFIITGTIGTLATLDFLGFGLPSSAPSLGELTQQAKQNLQAPWLALHRLLHLRDHAVAAGVHLRRRARRVRSAEDLPMSRLLDVRDLTVRFRQDGGTTRRCAASAFDVDKGETVALVGESGSGKSVTALSTVSLLGEPPRSAAR